MRDVVVDALATYRLTKLVVDDVITAPMREKIFEKTPPTEERWSYVLTCPWCASIWIGAAVALARKFFPRVWDVAATGLTASAVTGIVSERV